MTSAGHVQGKCKGSWKMVESARPKVRAIAVSKAKKPILGGRLLVLSVNIRLGLK